MFRQDYRINRIFLPFLPVPLKAGKKGKKHHPSAREVVHSLRQHTVMQGKSTLLIPRIFFRCSEIAFSRLHLVFSQGERRNPKKKSSQSC